MGTVAYMSPEQASGKPVDKRADIWAFGVILFEMLTGRRAFDGETVSHVLAAVLNTEPNWTALPPETPALLRRILRRCLEKDRKERIHDIADARLDIAEARAPGTDAEPAVVPPLRVWQRPGPVVVAVLAALGIGGLAVWSLSPDPVPHLARFVVTAPPSEPANVTFSFPTLAISPDGQRVVYAAGTPHSFTCALWIGSRALRWTGPRAPAIRFSRRMEPGSGSRVHSENGR